MAAELKSVPYLFTPSLGMNQQKNRFRLPLQKLSFMADWRIERRLKKAMKARRGEDTQGWGWFFSPKFATVSLSLILVVVGMGAWRGPDYVYNSQQVIRGDAFYGYKRSVERQKLSGLKNPASRANFYLVLSDRRLAEARVALHRSHRWDFLVPSASAAGQASASTAISKLTVDPGNNIAAGLLSESAYFVGKSVSEAGKIKNKLTANKVFENIKNTAKRHQQVLQKIKTNESNFLVQEVAEIARITDQSNEKLIEKVESVLARLPETIQKIPALLVFEPLVLEIRVEDLRGRNRHIRYEVEAWEALEDDWHYDDDDDESSFIDFDEFEETLQHYDWGIPVEILEEILEDRFKTEDDDDEEISSREDIFDVHPLPTHFAETWYNEYEATDWEHWEEEEEEELEGVFEDRDFETEDFNFHASEEDLEFEGETEIESGAGGFLDSPEWEESLEDDFRYEEDFFEAETEDPESEAYWEPEFEEDFEAAEIYEEDFDSEPFEEREEVWEEDF